MDEKVTNDKKAATQPRVEPPILPREAVQWAWSLTIGQSSSKDDSEILKERQKDIFEYITGIKEELQKSSKATQQNIRYVDAIYAAINSCIRTLHIIIRGRDLKFEEVDKLREVYIAKAEAITTFSGNLQSAFGRIATMTFGGTSATAIVAYYFPNIPTFFLPLVLAAAGALSFGVHEQYIKPWRQKENARANIMNAYQRDLYYQQYVGKCKSALRGLFKESLDLYKDIYGVPFDTKYDKPGEIDEFVNTLLQPMEFKGHTCKKIHECFKNKKIMKKENLYRWPTCESGEGVDACTEYKL